MKKVLIISIPIILVSILLSKEYKHSAMTIFQLLYYHGSLHQDNKIFPSVIMEGNQTIKKFERNLIKYDKSKYNFTKYSSETFLVLYKNKIVIEEYYNNYTENSYFNLYSAAKTIVSLGIGILHDRNLLSLNDKIKKYLPFLPFKDETTIKNVMQMSSGYSIPKIPTMVDMGFDYFAYNLTDRLINYKVDLNPGEYFLYKNLNTQILGLLIEKVSGQKLNDFIYENIYKYIGRDKAIWSTDRCGNIKAFCCLFLKNEDFLRFGKLVLDKGKIGDKIIISEQYINDVFTPDYKLIDIKEGGDKNYFYGLQGWTINTHDGHKIKYYWGMQGQFDIIIDDLDLVISTFGNYKGKGYRKIVEKLILQMVEDVRKILFG
jgi:CubicO group peptidase (beta-lactamase class C family)